MSTLYSSGIAPEINIWSYTKSTEQEINIKSEYWASSVGLNLSNVELWSLVNLYQPHSIILAKEILISW